MKFHFAIVIEVYFLPFCRFKAYIWSLVCCFKDKDILNSQTRSSQRNQETSKQNCESTTWDNQDSSKPSSTWFYHQYVTFLSCFGHRFLISPLAWKTILRNKSLNLCLYRSSSMEIENNSQGRTIFNCSLLTVLSGENIFRIFFVESGFRVEDHLCNHAQDVETHFTAENFRCTKQ